MSAGKGMKPKSGYNQKLYTENYDKINWKQKPIREEKPTVNKKK